MARPVRGCLIALVQPEGTEKPDINPSISQQEEQPNAIEGKVIADYNLGVDYEGSKPENEPDAPEEKEENSDEDYMKMEILCQGTLCQKSMSHKLAKVIKCTHQMQGPEIMGVWLQDMYIELGFSPKAASLLIREQGLDSPEMLQVPSLTRMLMTSVM